MRDEVAALHLESTGYGKGREAAREAARPAIHGRLSTFGPRQASLAAGEKRGLLISKPGAHV